MCVIGVTGVADIFCSPRVRVSPSGSSLEDGKTDEGIFAALCTVDVDAAPADGAESADEADDGDTADDEDAEDDVDADDKDDVLGIEAESRCAQPASRSMTHPIARFIIPQSLVTSLQSRLHTSYR
jgi:hypothetical protein